MDIRLKRRLAGGAVLVLLAVIFVPMLFEDALQPESALELPHPDDDLLPDSEQPATSLMLPLDAAPQVPLPSSWAVQVGSFSSAENAEALVKKLKRAGFPAFVVKRAETGKLLYRVRVGPLLDKDRAVALAEQIKEKVDLKGFVVPHP